MTIHCMAHRGASLEAPENTLAAFKRALDYKVAWIELDVQLSWDGVPVVIHDTRVNRTTNGRGRVKDFTLSELKRLSAGGWFSDAYAGETIPTLEEVLDLVKSRAKLNIEIKQMADCYPGLEEKVVDLVVRKGMSDDCLLTSFDQFAVQKLKQMKSKMKTGMIVAGGVVDLVPHALHLGVDYLSVYYPFVTASLLQQAELAGLDIVAWTVDDVNEIHRLEQMGPVMICTNDPLMYRAYQNSQSGPSDAPPNRQQC